MKMMKQATYPTRKLLSGYGLSDNTPYRCLGNQYRNGNIDIDHNETLKDCTTCPGGSTGNNGTEVLMNYVYYYRGMNGRMVLTVQIITM